MSLLKKSGLLTLFTIINFYAIFCKIILVDNSTVGSFIQTTNLTSQQSSECDKMNSTMNDSTFRFCGDINVTTTPANDFSTISFDNSLFLYVGYVVVPLLLLMGICGNILTIIVMRSQMFRYMTISVILTALSISDTSLLLLLPFNKAFVRTMLGFDVRALSGSVCKVFFCLFRSAKMTSSWFVVFISLERFCAVWFPLKIKQISSKRNAYIAITVVYIVIYGFNGVWTFSSVLKDGVCIPNFSTNGNEKSTAVFLLAGTTIYSFIPTCLLVMVTPLTIGKLYRQRQIRKYITQSQSQRTENITKTTVMLLGVTIAYVVLVGPISVMHLIAFFKGENLFESKDLTIATLREVSQVMEQLNYAINFFLYVICSGTFRKRCEHVLKTCIICKTTRTAPRDPPSGNTRTNLSTISGNAVCTGTS